MNLLKLKSIVTGLNRSLERPVFQVVDTNITFLGVTVYTQDQLAPYMQNNPALTEDQAVRALVAVGLAQISDTIAKVTGSMVHDLVEPMEDEQAVETMVALGAAGSAPIPNR